MLKEAAVSSGGRRFPNHRAYAVHTLEVRPGSARVALLVKALTVWWRPTSYCYPRLHRRCFDDCLHS
ncbi:unnamed protein product, partial [Ectocarpus sp. 12 AP-2014]